MNIFSSMRQTIMRSVSKNNAGKTLLLIAMAIVAGGLLIGCPDQASGGGETPPITITARLVTPNVYTGSVVEAVVTITNNGTEATKAATATLYRSDDATIATTDTPVTVGGNRVTSAIPVIAAKGSATVRFVIPAAQTGTAGTLNYGVCIDAPATCSAGAALTVNATPALRITALTTTTTSVGQGGSFTPTVTVSNSGTEESAATTISFFVVDNAGVARRLDGMLTVPKIAAKGTADSTGTITLPANTVMAANNRLYAVLGASNEYMRGEATGISNTFILGISVDSAGAVTGTPTLFTVTPPGPDLQINSFTITGDTTSVVAGNTFTANVVVRNAGAVATSAATSVSFALVDSAGMNPIPLTGTIAVATNLAAGANTGTTPLTGTITVPAGTADGTDYRVRAMVATVTGENNTANNTFTLGGDTTTAFTVLEAVTNLEIMSFTINGNPTSVVRGNTFTAEVVVRNAGTVASDAATTVSFEVVPTSGAAIPLTGTVPVATVAAGANTGTSPLTATITVPVGTAVGTDYRVRATVALGGNTALLGTGTGTVFSITAPDLQINSFTITGDPTSALQGGTFTANVVVRNAGTAATSATALVSFALVDSDGTSNPIALTVTPADATVPTALAAGANATALTPTITVPVGTAVGTDYRVLATVGTVTAESDTTNNTRLLGTGTGTVFSIIAPAPDLSIAAPTISGTTPHISGNMRTLSAVVTNSGTANSTDGTVTFYRQAGGSPVPATDTSVGTATLTTINSGSSGNTATATSGMFALGSDGNAVYYAVISGVTGETATGNNTSPSSATIAIVASTIDLRVVDSSFTTSSTTVVAGSTFTANVGVINNGNTQSAATTVSFALVPTGGGAAIDLTGTVSVPIVAAGATTSPVPSGTITVPADTDGGRYFLRATVDGNSSRLGGTPSQPNFEITAPDLMVTLLTTTVRTVAAGGVFTANVVVRNTGDVATSVAETVSFALVPTGGGAVAIDLNGTITVPTGLAVNMSTASLPGTITVPTDVAAGRYFLRATVDGNHYRLDGTPSQPNFEITDIITTTFNLVPNCLVLIGEIGDTSTCTASARTTALAQNDVIGTVRSSGATEFALANTVSNPPFVINSTTGVVTANRGVALADAVTMFDITVTGGVAAGTQRVSITNNAATTTTVDSRSIGAPIRTSGVVLYEPGITSTTHACIGEEAGCVTSYQQYDGAAIGWYSPYNSGTTAAGFNANAYDTVYIEYNLNTNTRSGAATPGFRLRLGYAYFEIPASDLTANSTWQTVSVPLSTIEDPLMTNGEFSRSSISNIGFYSQGGGNSLSVRAVYLR